MSSGESKKEFGFSEHSVQKQKSPLYEVGEKVPKGK